AEPRRTSTRFGREDLRSQFPPAASGPRRAASGERTAYNRASAMPILLSEQDVRMVLSMDDLIPAMETALAAFSGGRVKQPLRSVIEVGPHKGFFGVMPAETSEPAVIGTKLVTVFHGNLARNLPSHLASIVLMDPET